MNVLCYGAGALGSLYAARLQNSGLDVSILARGQRFSELQEHGIVLENGSTGRRTTTRVRVVADLAPSDAYDLVLVLMGKHHIPAVLPQLAANVRTPHVLFMCNNAAGPPAMVRALGEDRVLLGFAGAAGYRTGHVIRYVVVSRREQATTVGEVSGDVTTRVRGIADAFEAASFPAAVSRNMDAWLRTHAAEIVPTAGGFYMAGSQTSQLAASTAALDLIIEAIRENYRVLRARGIPLTPRNHTVFQVLPVSFLRRVMKRMLTNELAELKLGHGRSAAVEMKLLADELRELGHGTSPTPAMDELYTHITDAATLQSSPSLNAPR